MNAFAVLAFIPERHRALVDAGIAAAVARIPALDNLPEARRDAYAAGWLLKEMARLLVEDQAEIAHRATE